LAANAWEDMTVLTLSPPERAFADTLSAALGAGERTCLSVAIHRRGILASDDGDARRAARNYGVFLTGSLGILALNTRSGVIKLAEGNKLLERPINKGYRSPVTTLDDLVNS
jgi:predicted nucleic acid-binding protein